MASSYSSNYLRLLSVTKQLTSHVKNGHHNKALSLFHQLQSSPNLTLDPFVFSLTLKSCTVLTHSQLGVSIHCHSLKSSFLQNPFISSSLIDMYGKCVSISLARKLFDETTVRNVVVWNAMISLYVNNGDVGIALNLFGDMDVEKNESTFNSIIAGLGRVEEGTFKAISVYRRMVELRLRPNLITLLALLPACVVLAELNLIKEIHGYGVRNDIDPHPQLRSGLVEAYGRCGSLVYASSVFNGMKERDVVAWSSLISAYAVHGEAKRALGIFKEMENAKVRPDVITFLSVLKACSHAGSADEALYYFSRMRTKYDIQPDSDNYSCLIDVLSRAGRLHEACEVIREMPMKATAKAWGALLGACRTYGEVEIAEFAARELFKIEPENPANFVLMARIYASVGRHEEAEELRQEMKERGVKASPGSSWVVHQE
ncbi:hypothetical protein ACFE04_030946 [Oxalis oulophora]